MTASQPSARVLRACAAVIAAGAGDAAGICRDLRAALDLPPRERCLRPLGERLARALPAGRRPSRREALAALRADDGFRRACRRYQPRLRGLRPHPVMRPAAGRPATWDVPPWNTADRLARALGCTSPDLAWLAGGHPSRPLPEGPRHHYRYRWIAKASGGERLIEQPKARLKRVQRLLLAELVGRIPVHDAAHGFVRGRSLRGFAAPHAGRYVVVRLDLEDFFPSVRGARVLGLLATAGYPEEVARLIAGLTCNRVPTAQLLGRADARGLLADWHLPQGAPTSPALANACAYRLDCRLAGLARAAGARYTRYADDLVFSGDRALAVHLPRFLVRAQAIILAEGYRPKWRKTRVMRRGARQRVAGLVVNGGVHVARAERERLEAILFNCARHGPLTQNRAGHADFRAHLAGRIAWVAQHQPRHAQPLHELFGRIAWPAPAAG